MKRVISNLGQENVKLPVINQTQIMMQELKRFITSSIKY